MRFKKMKQANCSRWLGSEFTWHAQVRCTRCSCHHRSPSTVRTLVYFFNLCYALLGFTFCMQVFVQFFFLAQYLLVCFDLSLQGDCRLFCQLLLLFQVYIQSGQYLLGLLPLACQFEHLLLRLFCKVVDFGYPVNCSTGSEVRDKSPKSIQEHSMNSVKLFQQYQATGQMVQKNRKGRMLEFSHWVTTFPRGTVKSS